jgi:Outer membrane protein beta-barrel domain
MKRVILILSILGFVVLAPPAAVAEDKAYFGVAMFNSTYKAGGNDHRSTGVVGRLGYDLSRHVALETHFGGSIGRESNVNTNYGQAQIIDLYSVFLCLNSHFGNKRVYALGGVTYGTRELKGSNSSAATRNADSNKSFGFGVEAYENDAISFQLEWVRYFDNRYYRVDAWNLGLVTRF